MNWLAHIHLSPPDVEFQLGNVIADVIKGEARHRLAPGIQRGVACHLAIDNFTDDHAIFKASRQRISQPHRKFASILIDIFYDHYLAANWVDYSAILLDDFVEAVYANFTAYTTQHLPQAQDFVYHMVQQDWLREYKTVDGVARTLARVSRRLKRPGILSPMLDELRDNYADLEADFRAFYPQLQAHVLNVTSL